MLPGERGNRLASARLARDRLPLESNLWLQLQEVAARGPADAVPPPRQADGTSVKSKPGGGSAAAQPGAKAGPGTWKVATRLVHPATKNEDPYAGMG
jgi:hypothetical protein